MKKITLLIIVLLLSTATFGQNCMFTATNTPGTTSYSFVPNTTFSSTLFRVLWDFGDGNFSSDTLPTHAYNSTGPFVACFYVYDLNQTLLCSHCDSVGVGGGNPSNCSFTTQLTTGTLTATFTPPAAYSPPFLNYSFLWDFGDGNTATSTGVQTPSHTYTTAGVYNICLTVLDASSIVVCTSCSPVQVSSSSTTCTFTATPDSTGSNFQFATNAFASTVTWDFGDNSSGTGAVVTHQYSTPGVYTVCVSQFDNTGQLICNGCNQITVSATGSNCSFTITPDANDSMLFYFQSSATSNASVTWDFGDGTTDTGLSVSHHYMPPGSPSGAYTVCAVTYANGIACTFCDVVNIRGNSQPCTITYTIDPLQPYLVVFNATPSNSASLITWDFGDGSAPGTGANATHQYSVNGTYTVCITETDFFGTVLCTTCISITINGSSSNCQAYFVASNLGLTAYFIDLSNVNSGTATYAWDFGDGNVGSNRFAQHTYAIPGQYNICLTVSDNGCTDTYCSGLYVDTTVGNPSNCQAYFVLLQMAPFQFVVVNLTTGMNLAFTWDFGDGSPTSNLPYPTHFYSTTGSYNLCLTVSDNRGCTSTYCDSVQVDSAGNIFRTTSSGFTINVVSPAQLVGVEEIANVPSFSLYPNPAMSTLHVTLLQEMKGNASYTVYSIDGSAISNGIFSKVENKLNIESWSPGAYILELRDSQGYKSYQKLIKE